MELCIIINCKLTFNLIEVLMLYSYNAIKNVFEKKNRKKKFKFLIFYSIVHMIGKTNYPHT